MTNTEKGTSKLNPSGPEPKRIKLEDDWHNAIGKALKKERPKEGWPKPEKKDQP